MKKIDYRNQALKILPWVCARCGREHTSKNLKQLTVHHKDHNHDNNPSDGSNWELLCIYCHDAEHSRALDAEWLSAPDRADAGRDSVTHSPFADRKKLLDGSNDDE